MNKIIFQSMILLLLASLLSACGVVLSVETEQPDQSAIHTQVAQTIYAEATLTAGASAIARLTEMAQVPPTATPTLQPDTPTAQPSPTATLVPPTPVPPTPTPTVTPIPCDRAQFVSDVTVKDGTSFTPGTSFVKTWRLKNVGSCTWTNAYALVFSSGAKMDAPDAVGLTGSIKPGESVDLSVTLIAPSKEGSHTGYWMLRNASGVIFGLGANGDKAFWVNINVASPKEVVYSFSKDYCNADWRTSAGQVECPTPSEASAAGSVKHDDQAHLETGRTENERALVVHPNDGQGGMISGEYPEVRIKAGDRFRTVIGCMYNAFGCTVTFQLSYSIDGSALKELGRWTESYDDSFAKIDVDLSALAGKDVVFVLTVYNNGGNVDDWAFWLLPRIVR